MKAMARQRSHSIEFKRQVAQEFIAGESLYALSKRHDNSRQLIRVWVQKYEAGGPLMIGLFGLGCDEYVYRRAS
jgi:transposase-like protein